MIKHHELLLVVLKHHALLLVVRTHHALLLVVLKHHALENEVVLSTQNVCENRHANCVWTGIQCIPDT